MCNKKKITYFFLIPLLFLPCVFIGCSEKKTEDYIVVGKELIECVSKLDNSKILYYKENAVKYIPENLPVEIYYITDVRGKIYSLNNYEIENYTCSKIEKTSVK